MFWNDNPGRYVAAGRIGAFTGGIAAGARGLYDMGRAYKRAVRRFKGSPQRRTYSNDPTRGLRPQHQTRSRITGKVSKFGRPFSERYLRIKKRWRRRPRKVTRRKRYRRKYKR